MLPAWSHPTSSGNSSLRHLCRNPRRLTPDGCRSLSAAAPTSKRRVEQDRFERHHMTLRCPLRDAGFSAVEVMARCEQPCEVPTLSCAFFSKITRENTNSAEPVNRRAGEVLFTCLEPHKRMRGNCHAEGKETFAWLHLSCEGPECQSSSAFVRVSGQVL